MISLIQRGQMRWQEIFMKLFLVMILSSYIMILTTCSAVKYLPTLLNRGLTVPVSSILKPLSQATVYN